MDSIEYNEAFAVISALFARQHPEALDAYLPLGGALSYGHPYGASGAILTLHALAHLTRKRDALALLLWLGPVERAAVFYWNGCHDELYGSIADAGRKTAAKGVSGDGNETLDL